MTCGRNKWPTSTVKMIKCECRKRDLSKYLQGTWEAEQYFLSDRHEKLNKRSGAVTNPYGELCGYMSWSSTSVLRVKVGLRVTQEVRFEHISTAPVGQKAALVQIHLLSWCLEVQSHWRTERMKLSSIYCWTWRHAGMSECSFGSPIWLPPFHMSWGS